MNKKNIQVKPGTVEISEYSHHSIGLTWKESLEKYMKNIQDTKIISEISMIEENNKEGWKRIYIGYATTYTHSNLKENAKYAFKLRFKVKDDWSPHSEAVISSTSEKPMTGEHLHKAIRSNNIKDLEHVLENGKVNIEAQDGLGFTPLMVASQRNLIDIMKLLLKKGADIEAKTDSGKSALMLACFKGEWEAIDLLIQHGADVNNTDRSRLTALHYAVDGESTRAIRILGAAGADIDATDSVLGWSPLLRCAGLRNNGNSDIAKELIKLGTNINLQDKEGNTPLHLSVINGHYKLFEILLNAGTNVQAQNKLKHSVIKLVECSDNASLKQVLQQFLAIN